MGGFGLPAYKENDMPQPNAYFWGLQSLSRDIKLVFGSFEPAGTGVITDAKGDGWAATRSAQGTFTITFTHNWKDLIGHFATIRHTTAVDLVPQFGDYVAASRTLVLRLNAAGTATDMAADAGADNVVNFVVAFKRTTTTPQSTATVS
jgi:hypothetical protein